jgi:hypothetical protein
MANKITISIGVRLSGTGFSISGATSSTIDQVGTDYTAESQLIDKTTPALLDIGTGITEGQLGFLWVRNTDEANFVTLSSDAPGAVPIAKIPAGRSILLHPDGGTKVIYAKADTANVVVDFMAIEI